MAIRIVLATDNYLVREGVRRLLDTEPDVEIAAACVDRDSLLAAIERERFEASRPARPRGRRR